MVADRIAGKGLGWGRNMGFLASLMASYFLAHLIWPSAEPLRVLWTGAIGTAVEWLWWAWIGWAVRATMLPEPARAGHWAGPLVITAAAGLVWGAYVLGQTVTIDVSVSVLFLDFDHSVNGLLPLFAFGLGFFHHLVVAWFRRGGQAVRRLVGRWLNAWRSFRRSRSSV